MDTEKIFGWVGICLSSCFYCSLVIPFFNVFRCKKSFELTPINFINIIYIDCLSWYIYGDKILCNQIKLCHCIGGITSLSLIIIYLCFEIKKYLIDTILNCIILILGTLVVQKGLSFVIEDINIVGKICVGIKIITFITPIIMICKVNKEKNYILISSYNIISYLVACIGWAVFGKIINNFNIMCSYSVGIAFGFIQFLVYMNFKKKYPRYSGPSSTIGIESGSSEEPKKDESTTINIDEESQERAKEKPVKIITRIENSN